VLTHDVFRHRVGRHALLAILASSLILAAQIDSRGAPTFTGVLDASLRYNVSSGSLQHEGEATVELTFATWEASAELGFDEGIWDDLTFEVLWSEEAVEIASALRFEPDMDRFRDWKTSIAWTFGAVDIELAHNLTRTRNWLTLEADWVFDTVEIDTRVRLRSTGCGRPHLLYDAEAKAEFTLCGTDTSIEVEFDHDGFDALTLTIEELVIDRIPWLSLDIEATRTATETTIEIDPSVELGAAACLTFDAEVTGSDAFVGALQLVEASLECDVPWAAIEATVYLDPDDWIDDRYAATLTLETEGSLAQERAIETETMLFWTCVPTPNLMLARMMHWIQLELSERISVWLELDIDVELAGLDSIAAGAELTW
jgi:hypothetical protein